MTCLGAISRYPLLLLGHSYLMACGVIRCYRGRSLRFTISAIKFDR